MKNNLLFSIILAGLLINIQLINSVYLYSFFIIVLLVKNLKKKVLTNITQIELTENAALYEIYYKMCQICFVKSNAKFNVFKNISDQQRTNCVLTYERVYFLTKITN
jgi:hypothetical protein